MKRFIFLFLLILVFGSQAWAATYYMRADGTAANMAAATGPVTDASKCASLATHNAGWAGFSPGDIIYLGDTGGSYTGANLAIGSDGSLAGGYITYINAPGHSPVVDATGVDYGLWMGNRVYLRFEGIWFKNATLYNVLINGTHLVFYNCESSGAGQHGFAQVTTNGGDILIEKCRIHNNGLDGIIAYKIAGTSGHETIIRNCDIYSNHRFGVYLLANYYIVESNRLWNNGNVGDVTSAIEVYTDLADGYAAHVIIRYNTVSGQISGVDDGEGIYADSKSQYVDIYYNLVYACDGPGIAVNMSNNVNIFNNTLYGNCQNSSGALNYKTELKIIGTTPGDTTNVVVKNNIAQATKSSTYAILLDANTYGMVGLNITNNVWYTAAANWYYWNNAGGNVLATWNALTGVGTDLNADPLFFNAAGVDFRLGSGSPAVHTGDNTPWSGTASVVDYIGTSITDSAGSIVVPGGLVSIGAYEYLSGGTKGLGFRGIH